MGHVGDGSNFDNNMYLTADVGDFHFYTAGGAALTAKSNGSVGIGTTAPAKKLTVDGDMEIGIHNADCHHLRIGGGNSDGSLYGLFAAFGDGIHMGYNYYADAAGANHYVQWAAACRASAWAMANSAWRLRTPGSR